MQNGKTLKFHTSHIRLKRYGQAGTSVCPEKLHAFVQVFFNFLKNATFNPRPRDADSKSVLRTLPIVEVLPMRVFIAVFVAARHDDEGFKAENMRQRCLFNDRQLQDGLLSRLTARPLLFARF